MTSDDQILSEIQKINQTLDKLNSKSNLAKNSLNNFIAGFFHSVGNFFGTIIIFLILLLVASRLNLTQAFTSYFENWISKINWSKIIPPAKIELDSKLF